MAAQTRWVAYCGDAGLSGHSARQIFAIFLEANSFFVVPFFRATCHLQLPNGSPFTHTLDLPQQQTFVAICSLTSSTPACVARLGAEEVQRGYQRTRLF